jgi:hypothetical protein
MNKYNSVISQLCYMSGKLDGYGDGLECVSSPNIKSLCDDLRACAATLREIVESIKNDFEDE